MRKIALVILLAIAVALACSEAAKLAPKVADPSAAILEAKKLCTIYSMGPMQDRAVSEACAELLGGCTEGAGGAPQ